MQDSMEKYSVSDYRDFLWIQMYMSYTNQAHLCIFTYVHSVYIQASFSGNTVIIFYYTKHLYGWLNQN